MLNVNAFFNPEVAKAYSKNDVELTLEVQNLDNDTLWCEADVLLPSLLSLAPHADVKKGRLRVGIISPHDKIEKKIKIYSEPNVYPDNYEVHVVFYFFDKKGVISERVEKKYTLKIEAAQNVQNQTSVQQ